MLLIREDTRVADIYLTEIDRIMRHFYFRDVAARESADGEDENARKGKFLDESDDWLRIGYKAGTLKARRQRMLFPA